MSKYNLNKLLPSLSQPHRLLKYIIIPRSGHCYFNSTEKHLGGNTPCITGEM